MKRCPLSLFAIALLWPASVLAGELERLHLGEDETYEVAAAELPLVIGQLVMERGATILLPPELDGQEVRITVHRLTAAAQTQITQTLGARVRPRRGAAGERQPPNEQAQARSGRSGDHASGQPDYGKKGHPGGDGEDGAHGRSTCHLVLDLGVVWVDDLLIELVAEHGGHGGFGGNGGLGGGCKLQWDIGGGDGGAGGNAGNGGNGGNAGPVTVRWYPVDAPVPQLPSGLPVGLSISLCPGLGGWGGAPGRGGDGHWGASNAFQGSVPAGKAGRNGSQGAIGRNGEALPVEVVPIDPLLGEVPE